MENNILHQPGSNFLVQKSTDELCRMEPCHFSDSDCLLAMSLSQYVFPEERFEPSFLCGEMHHHPEEWAQHHQTSFGLMESTCAFPEVLAAIFPGPLPDISPISSVILEMCSFSSSSSFFVSLDLHQTKVPASYPCPKQIGDSSLNITFIQPSTVHDCFSSAHCDLVFSLGVSVGLLLSHFLHPVSYSSLTNIDFCFCPFVFNFFVEHFQT